MRKIHRNILALLMGLALLVSIFPAGALAETVEAPPDAGQEQSEPVGDGTLRVMLKSLGDIASVALTLDGSYSIDGNAGFRFERGTKVIFLLDGENVDLYLAGLTINMGASVTLVRHEVGGNNGMYIHGSEKDNLYSGDLQISADGEKLQLILAMDIKEYLYGVVPYEMSDSFPIEALKAQAVAARTYALRRREQNADRAYDLVDTAQDQVFKGYDPDCENAIRAVNETRGLCGMYQGRYATCFYTASNGGQTALAGDIWGGGDQDLGHMTMHDDPYDLENPRSVVKELAFDADLGNAPSALKRMLASQIPEILSGLGFSDEEADFEIERVLSIEPHSPRFEDGSRMYAALRLSLKVRARRLLPIYATPAPVEGADAENFDASVDASASATPAPAPAGREGDADASPQEAEIIGWTRGELETVEDVIEVNLTVYDQVKEELGLGINSSDYEVISVGEVIEEGGESGEPQSFLIQMRRYGHGVGMSQRGAEWMAERYGKRFDEILKFYYPGMDLVQVEMLTRVAAPLGKLPSTLGTERLRPTPRPTQAPLPALEEGEYYAEVKLSSKASALNIREQPTTDALRVGVLYGGDRVIVSGEAGEGWVSVRTSEFSGYAASEYLTKITG